MLVGITGKSGSGKSYLSSLIRDKFDFVYLDVDKMVKPLRDKNREEICLLVGCNVILDEQIDSKKLGNILFKNKELMEKYNEYIYRLLKEEIKKEVERHDNVVIDTMFLPLMDVRFDCDLKILVEADLDTRKKRVLKRDNINEEYFDNRDKFSLEYNKREYDFVVNTSNSKHLDIVLEHLAHMQNK